MCLQTATETPRFLSLESENNEADRRHSSLLCYSHINISKQQQQFSGTGITSTTGNDFFPLFHVFQKKKKLVLNLYHSQISNKVHKRQAFVKTAG